MSRNSLFSHGPAASLALLGLITALTSTAAATAPPHGYRIIDLGVNVSPMDINNTGTVVGSRQPAPGTAVGFLYSIADSQLTDIPGTTTAHAVNDQGQVAGNGLGGAFLYQNSSLTYIGDPQGAYGINEAGRISGNQAMPNPYRPTPLPLAPAIYDISRQQWDVLDIARLYPRGTRQGVYADLFVLSDINDAGYAVGRKSRYGLSGSSAILATPDFDGVSYLPTPYGGSASAINNQNMVVGTTGSDPSSANYAHAFLFDYNTNTLTDLGTLNGGLTSSAADINASNQVVGSAWLSPTLTSLYQPDQYHAFLWQDGQMTDLNAWLPASSGWVLTAATAINDQGDIVGKGLLGGQWHGFLLTTDQLVSLPPSAVAAANTRRGRAPLVVSFDSASSYDPDGQIVAHAWDFGDGTTSTEISPSHTFTQRGLYLVSLTVTDDAGLSDVATLRIRVLKAR